MPNTPLHLFFSLFYKNLQRGSYIFRSIVPIYFSGFQYSVVIRGIFRNQTNIYDGVFLRKNLTAFGRYLFLQKSSIVDIRLDFKYTSD